MKKSDLQMTQSLYQYLLDHSLREHPCLEELRIATAKHPRAIMQIPPEQGQFMAFLIQLLQAERILEVGTFTGYSALSMALALPEHGHLTTCDINQEWTEIGIPFWQQAGVKDKISLRLGPASDTLDQLLVENGGEYFDFAFIDADKTGYDDYYEKCLALIKPGGLIAIDNVFLFGSVVSTDHLSQDRFDRLAQEDIEAIKNMNKKIKNDQRVDLSMLPMADGLTLVRKR